MIPGRSLRCFRRSRQGIATQIERAPAVLFRVRNDGKDEVRVVLNQKSEALVAVHPGLPEIRGLVAFLGMQRGAVEIFRQVSDLLVECPLNRWRRGPIVPLRPPGMCPGHLVRKLW